MSSSVYNVVVIRVYTAWHMFRPKNAHVSMDLIRLGGRHAGQVLHEYTLVVPVRRDLLHIHWKYTHASISVIKFSIASLPRLHCLPCPVALLTLPSCIAYPAQLHCLPCPGCIAYPAQLHCLPCPVALLTLSHV